MYYLKTLIHNVSRERNDCWKIFLIKLALENKKTMLVNSHFHSRPGTYTLLEVRTLENIANEVALLFESHFTQGSTLFASITILR